MGKVANGERIREDMKKKRGGGGCGPKHADRQENQEVRVGMKETEKPTEAFK